MGCVFLCKMAADLFCITLFTFLFTLPALIGSQSNRTVFSPSSTSGCTCDLTGNGCDLNCCCDTDCTTTDEEAFTECKDNDVNRDSRVCVSEEVIFKQNTKFSTETTGTGLFCIVRDNYESRNFYNDVQTATTGEEFSNLKSQSAAPAAYDYSEQSQTSSTGSTSYKVGDPIILQFSNGAKGFLALPKPLLGEECDDRSAAGYRQDASTECTRTIADLSTECESNPILSARSYFTGFEVVKNPAIVPSNSTISNSTSNSTSSVRNSVAVEVKQPILCKTSLGIPIQCSFTEPPHPTLDAQNKTCNDVTLEVSYTLSYSNDSTDIVSVMAEFVLGSITAKDGVALRQKVSVRFLKAGSDDNTFRRSGNPGYILGEPLVAGNLTTKFNGDKIPQGSQLQCKLLQETAYNTLLGDQPTHVASFGNSDVNSVGDWVEILNTRPSDEPVQGDSECRNMRLGLHIEVLFANFGFLAKPQPRVVGVMYKYDEPKDIQYQCSGINCQPGSSSLEQKVEVVSSVGFVDVSNRPEPQVKPLPTFEAKAASDFFFPFF
ncbi:Tectonic-3 [Stylophora pistillata]|uniref:Tectonic-3 n=1 Tax=Stylophora pistillata TaxID=50429 RepID=A0A2B4S7A2_STYPI|nr:Tectonic-3 [Stylophora pistillata]